MSTPTDKRPAEHLSLSDGSNTVTLILSDANGKSNPRAIQKVSRPLTSIKQSTGSTQYSDFEEPYLQRAQIDWSGGRGADVYEKDETRYHDSYRVDTTSANQLILGPQETYGSGFRKANFILPGNMGWQALKGTADHIAAQFTPDSNYTAEAVWIYIRKQGNPTVNVEVHIYSDSAGEPNASRTSDTIVVANLDSTLSTFKVNTGISTAQLAGTTYWVVIKNASTVAAGATDYCEIGVDFSTNGKYSSDGSTWSSVLGNPYFRVTDAEDSYIPHFFDFKGATYMVTQPDDGGTSRLFISGDRGTADSNSGNKALLNDATKSWTADEWIGAYVKLTGGKGSEETQNWREITDNDATSLTVSPAWKITHDTTTEYVIVGADQWTEITGHGLTAPVTSVAVVGTMVLFAQGEGTLIRVFTAFTSGGVWTRSFSNESYYALHLAVNSTTDGYEVWGTMNDHHYYGVCVWRADAPFRGLGVLADRYLEIETTDSPWDEQAIANVTQTSDEQSTVITIGAGFTTGVAASKAIASTNITQAEKIILRIKSSVTTSAGDLQLLLDDTANCASPVHTLDIPALSADAWLWCALDISPLASGGANAIISVGLNVATDLGAQVVTLHGGIYAARDPEFSPVGDSSERITGIEVYTDQDNHSSPAPYIFKEGSVYRVIDGVAQKMPLDEMSFLKDPRNGRAHAVGGAFLYFSLLEGIERYFSNQLDDIGPNREMGLPSSRQGSVAALLTYPGRLYAAYDAGNELGSFSSVLVRQGNGWHESYRAPQSVFRIRALHVQPTPGNGVDRLWIGMGTDLVWIPVALNPYQDENYAYTHEGTITSSWVYANLQDVDKIMESVSVFAENLSATNGVTALAQYQVDDDPDTADKSTISWTTISGTFDTSPSEELTLSATHNITGKRIRTRLILRTEDNTLTPRILAVVYKMVGFIPVKWQYPMSFRIADNDRDLAGNPDTLTSLDAKSSQLAAWINSAQALLVSSMYYELNGKYVKLDPYSWRPVKYEPRVDQETGIYQATLIEL